VPQYVVAGKKGSDKGVVTNELLCHDIGYTDVGLGVA
jgi:hypothetical protein